MSCWEHGYPWLSLATFPYRSSPQYVRAGRPAFARPCVGVHKSTSLMSSSLFLQQCPACLVLLTWIVFVIGGMWPYSWCLVGCCRQDLFKIAQCCEQSWTSPFSYTYCNLEKFIKTSLLDLNYHLVQFTCEILTQVSFTLQNHNWKFETMIILSWTQHLVVQRTFNRHSWSCGLWSHAHHGTWFCSVTRICFAV